MHVTHVFDAFAASPSGLDLRLALLAVVLSYATLWYLKHRIEYKVRQTVLWEQETPLISSSRAKRHMAFSIAASPSLLRSHIDGLGALISLNDNMTPMRRRGCLPIKPPFSRSLVPI